MLFDQLSLVWQAWGFMLLGAVALMAGLFIGIEWAWIASCARVARAWALRTFTAAGDDAGPTIVSIARARAHQLRARHAAGVRLTDGRVPLRVVPDADEVLIAARGRAHVFPVRQRLPHENDAERRRQLLALMESSPLPSRKTVH